MKWKEYTNAVQTRSSAMKYKFKQKPYRHQHNALKKLLTTGFGGALLMEPRTGKTKVAIDYASILHQAGKVNRVLIVAPVSVLEVWAREIALNCPFKYSITIWDKEGRAEYDLPPYGRDCIDFVIMNYDAMSVAGAILSKKDGVIRRSRSRGGRYDIKKKITKWKPQLIIADESHRLKSPRARKSTMMHGFARIADFRLILTGTAVTKKKRVWDIYSQWLFLNPDGWIRKYNLKQFKSEFSVEVQLNGYKKWIRNQNEPKLRRLIHQDAFAITRAECYDLPPRLPPQIVPVHLSDHTAKVYAEMAEEMIAKIKTGEITEASIKLVQTLRLAQITSGIVKTTPTKQHPDARLVRISKEKLSIVEELLSDLFEADQKVVVGARFRADIAGLVNLGKKKLKVPTYQLHGGVPVKQRHQYQIDPFRKQQGAALFVMQPQAGSLGIDLSTASTMIWYSLTTSYVDWTQSEDRIALSNVATSFIYLLAKGTIDELMYTSLLEDMDISKRISKKPELLRYRG